MDVLFKKREDAHRANLDLARRRNGSLGARLPSVKVVHFVASNANDDRPCVVAMWLARNRHSIGDEVKRRALLGANRKLVSDLLADGCFAILR